MISVQRADEAVARAFTGLGEPPIAVRWTGYVASIDDQPALLVLADGPAGMLPGTPVHYIITNRREHLQLRKMRACFDAVWGAMRDDGHVGAFGNSNASCEATMRTNRAFVYPRFRQVVEIGGRAIAHCNFGDLP